MCHRCISNFYYLTYIKSLLKLKILHKVSNSLQDLKCIHIHTSASYPCLNDKLHYFCIYTDLFSVLFATELELGVWQTINMATQ